MKRIILVIALCALALLSDAQSPSTPLRRYINRYRDQSRESSNGYHRGVIGGILYPPDPLSGPPLPRPSSSSSSGSYRNYQSPVTPSSASQDVQQVDKKLAQATRVIMAGNQFGLGLMKVLIAENDNTIMAPISLSVALGMLYFASAGNTKRELSRALHYDSFGLDSQSLLTPLRQLTAASKTENKGFKFERANFIFAQKGLNVSESYRKLLNDVFGGSVEDVEFTRPVDARKQINDKITAATSGQITDPIDDLDPGTRMVVANAVYFKGAWKKPFSTGSSFETTFFNDGKQEVGVRMMYTRNSFMVKSLPKIGADAIQLPYEGERSLMLVLLPKNPTGVNEMLEKLNVAELIEDLPTYENETLDLHIPRFSVHGSYGFKQQLYNLGVRDLFIEGKAELPLVDPSGEVVVDDIMHEAKIRVDESGTEAAAVTTGSIINYSRFPAFNVRHPFVFFVIHKDTGAVFFAGKILRINSAGGNPGVHHHTSASTNPQRQQSSSGGSGRSH